MKNKLLILYGYIIPFVASILLALVPYFTPAVSYVDIALYMKSNISLTLGYIALLFALTYPFQTKILAEDDKTILHILTGTSVREVFTFSLAIQAFLLILSSAILVIACTTFQTSALLGFWLVFISALMGFESLALISNGRAYGRIREKILAKTYKI